MTDPAPLPQHIAAALRDRAVRPALARAVRRAAPVGGVVLVVGPGAVAPEGAELETAGPALVGAVTVDRAREIAAARSAAAVEHLASALPTGARVWCLYLDAGQRCAVLPMGSGAPAPMGDA